MHGGEANNSGALRRDMSGRALLTVLVVGVAAVLAVGVGTLTALRLSSPRSSPTPKAAGTTGASRGTTKPTIQLQVVSTSPTAGATVAPDAAVSVTFSTPVDPSGPLPTLSPAIAGSWMAATPTTLAFHPDGPLPPASALTLSVPGGTQGVHGVDGSHLAVSTTVGFNVQPGTTVRLQQLLAQLGYLPVTFTPAGSPPPAVQMADTQAGSFSWRWPNLPAQLTALWQPGVYNEMTKAAVMAFEEANQLAVDGIAGPEVWQTLLHDATVGAHDPNPYSYVLVSKVSPETLNLWVNGASRFQNVLVNTGVPGADTPDGTYAVFEHVPWSRMQGTDPNGTTYNDPHVPWVSYFYLGDALHGYVRAQYGFPQSNGCVEMPVSTAQQVWPYTPIGTLVTVIGPKI